MEGIGECDMVELVEVGDDAKAKVAGEGKLSKKIDDFVLTVGDHYRALIERTWVRA